MAQVHSSTCSCPMFPTPLVVEIVLFPVDSFFYFVEDKLTIELCVHLWVLYSIPLTMCLFYCHYYTVWTITTLKSGIVMAFAFFKVYLFTHERHRETETQAEGDAGSQQGARCGTPGSRPGPKAGAKSLSHPGIPSINKSLKKSGGESLGGSVVQRLPLAQGTILESWDRVPPWAPGMEPASPSSCVSASLSLCLS